MKYFSCNLARKSRQRNNTCLGKRLFFRDPLALEFECGGTRRFVTIGLVVIALFSAFQNTGLAQKSGSAPGSKSASEFRSMVYLSGGRFPNEQIALESHIHHVSDIIFAFINPTKDATGEIAALSAKKDQSLRNVVAIAKKHKKRVFLSFGGWRGDDTGHDEVYEDIAANVETRKRFIQEILKLVEKYEVDGVDMDWEYPRLNTEARQYAQDYADFIHELAEALHQRNKLIGAAVIGVKDKPTDDGDGAAYLDSVFQDLDWVNLMSYDNSDSDHSTYENAEASLQYWIEERGLAPEKAILGMPIYARPGWIPYQNIIARYGKDQALLDWYSDADTGKAGGYNGIPTIVKKTSLALDRGLGGIMFWELPLDTCGEQTHLSLIKAAYDRIQDIQNKD
jgi:GH18 family chitinase